MALTGPLRWPTLSLLDGGTGEPRGLLVPAGAVRHAEGLDGEDRLELWATEAPRPGDRILWMDPDGWPQWREHVVTSTEERDPGRALVRAEGSVRELSLDFVEERQLVRRTAGEALDAALEGTAWARGSCDDLGGRRGCMLYHTDALSALRRVAEVWGGELEPMVDVEGDGTVRRTVSLLAARGDRESDLHVDASNLSASWRVTGDDDVYTALYGFGRGQAVLDENGVPTGAFTRRLTFASANGGRSWVGDDSARSRWGRWDAPSGGRRHSFGQVVFPLCNDPARLLEMTREVLSVVSAPRVAWRAEVADPEALRGARLGDAVLVADHSRGRGWVAKARVERIDRVMGPGRVDRRVTLGTGARPTLEEAADRVARSRGWADAWVPAQAARREQRGDDGERLG